MKKLTKPSTRGIALEMARLIRCGEIPVGTKLPSVRELGEAMGVSPATISSAWGQLRRFHVITGKGRNGIWVTADQASLRPVRFETVSPFGDRVIADLTLATPDPSLLPDLKEALTFGSQVENLNSYVRQPITQNLDRVSRARWPYDADDFLALNGGIEAVYTVLRTVVMPGTIVAVENPTATRLLDILEGLGAQLIAVTCDPNGPTEESLKSALELGASVFLYQPRTHTTTGHVVSSERMEALMRILEKSDALIIEDDGLGDLSEAFSASIGKWLPDQTIHIVSYSKSLGPDLRVAVLSGSHELVQRIRSYRNFGASWTSRILQDAVAWLLESPEAQRCVINAKAIYRERRERMVSELLSRNIKVEGCDGLSVWIEVPDQQFVVQNMAVRGFPVSLGSRFCLKTQGDHVRLSTSRLIKHYAEIAEALRLCINGSFESQQGSDAPRGAYWDNEAE